MRTKIDKESGNKYAIYTDHLDKPTAHLIERSTKMSELTMYKIATIFNSLSILILALGFVLLAAKLT